MILQNIWDRSPNNTASHFSRHKTLSKTAATASTLAQVSTQLSKFCVSFLSICTVKYAQLVQKLNRDHHINKMAPLGQKLNLRLPQEINRMTHDTTVQNTVWFKKMDSISYVYISWTIHGMWMIYITFEREGPKFSNTTTRVLAQCTAVQQRQLRLSF